MKNVTDSGQKVKGQKRLMALERASWILGIDVGKEKLSCALLLKDETFRCRFDVEASLHGFQMMLERVKTETKGEGAVMFALEPTGHYWMVLGQFFEDHNQSYVLVHPLVVARSREVKQLNRGKTDAFDACLIAELACRGSVTRTQIPEDDWATIRFYAREYMDREKEIAREKNRMMSYLETTLPGFLEIFPKPLGMNSRACLRVLANFREVLQGDIVQFESQARKHITGKRLMTSRVRRLFEMLQRGDALGLRAGRKTLFWRIINSLDRLELYEKQQDMASKALISLYEECEFKPYLDSVWGTSPLTNSLVLGFMGDPTSYDTPASLIKMAGCDPVPNESGKFKGKASISHRGRNLLRKAGDRISFLLEKRNTVFRNFMHHLTARPKNKLTKRQARIACINKYFRIIWVLCNHRVLFNPALA